MHSLNGRCSRRWLQDSVHREEWGIVDVPGPWQGGTVLDFGAEHRGTLGGGLWLAGLCTAFLGEIGIQPASPASLLPLPEVVVRTDHPLAACMASQYAGWPIQVGRFFAMGSGPGRILRGKEPLFEKYPFRDSGGESWLVLESARVPDGETFLSIAEECRIAPSGLRLCLARTASLAGSLQIVARSLETTMHKLFELEFDLQAVVSGIGSAPLPPIGTSDLQSIGWTNDAILYGSRIWIAVDCEQGEADRVSEALPSCRSADYGRPFLEVFERYGRDFYAVDRMLFSPALVTLHNLRTGITRVSGALRQDLLLESFGIATIAGESGRGSAE